MFSPITNNQISNGTRRLYKNYPLYRGVRLPRMSNVLRNRWTINGFYNVRKVSTLLTKFYPTNSIFNEVLHRKQPIFNEVLQRKLSIFNEVLHRKLSIFNEVLHRKLSIFNEVLHHKLPMFFDIFNTST